MELKSAVAIVTGAGRGIGRSIALEYASHGAKVALVSRTASQLEAVANEINYASGTALVLPLDVTDKDAVRDMVARVEKELGPVDILINNAGSHSANRPVAEVSPDLWLTDIVVNLYGPFLCAQAVLRHMLPRKRGYIINMIGGGVTSAFPYATAYGSSKAALMRLTEAMMIELDDTGIKVFALSPGLVRTMMVEHLLTSDEGKEWHSQRLVPAIEKGDDVPPTVAARAAVGLVSGRLDKLAGRAIMANRDDLEQLAQQVDAIVERDLRVLRLTGYP